MAEDTRNRYTIFSTLESYGIGVETTNQFDEIHPCATTRILSLEQLERADPVYGKSHICRSARAVHQWGSRTALEIGFRTSNDFAAAKAVLPVA